MSSIGSSILCRKCRKRMATSTDGLCDHCNYMTLLDALIEGQRKQHEANLQRVRVKWKADHVMQTYQLGKVVPPAIARPSAPHEPEQLRCMRCGRRNPALYDYCGRCGAMLKSTPVICPNCGEPTSSSASFCRKCGEPLREDETRIY